MARLMLVLLLLVLGAAPAHAENYTDWWWNPDQAGQGLNVGQQGSQIFVSWFSYDENGDDMWLVMGGTLSGNVFAAELQQTTGTPLGTAYNPALQSTKTVGHATLTFSDPFNATFAWSVNLGGGTKSGTLVLQRESYGLLPLAGPYLAAMNILGTGCSATGGQFAWHNSFTIADNPVTPALATFAATQVTTEGDPIAYTGTLEHAGRWLRSHGNYAGAGSPLGSGSYVMNVLAVDNAVILDATLTATAPAGCIRAMHAVEVQ